MAAMKADPTFAKLHEGEVEDYLRHLHRLGSDGQARRFGGQLSAHALAQRVEWATRNADCVIVARVGGHIRGALEIWAGRSRDDPAEIAFSVESAVSENGPKPSDVETGLLAHAVEYLRQAGIKQLAYLANIGDRLPTFPNACAISPWHRPSNEDMWICSLMPVLTNRQVVEEKSDTLPAASRRGRLRSPVGSGLVALGARGPILLVCSLLAGAALPPLATAAYPLLPLSAFLLSLGSFLAAGFGDREADVRIVQLIPLLVWLGIAIPLVAAALLFFVPLDPAMHAGALLSVLAPPVGSAAAIAAMLGLRPRLALVASILLTLAAPATMPLVATLLHLDVAMSMSSLALRLVTIVGSAALVAFVVLRFPASFRWAVPDQRAGTGLAVVGLVIVGLATAQGVRAQWLANAVLFEQMLGAAFLANFALCAVGAAAFYRLGFPAAATVGLLSGNRNVTLAWAATSTGASSVAEGYLAVCVVPVLALPLLIKWAQRTTQLISVFSLGLTRRLQRA